MNNVDSLDSSMELQYTFSKPDILYMEQLARTVQRLQLENTLKQQAIQTATNLILELKVSSHKTCEEYEEIIAKQQSEIAQLKGLLRISPQEAIRQAEKVKLRARFKNLLNVSTNSSNNTFSNSQQQSQFDENDPEVRIHSNMSIKPPQKHVRAVEELKRQLDLKDRKVGQLMKLHENKEGKYLRVIDSLRAGSVQTTRR